MGYNPKIILSGREVNDGMGVYVAKELIKLINDNGVENKKVLIMGVTFKENCPDFRNTRVIDIIEFLKNHEYEVDAFDPWVCNKEFKKEYNQHVYSELPNKKYDAIVLAVSHDIFHEIDLSQIKTDKASIVYDIKSFFSKTKISKRL